MRISINSKETTTTPQKDLQDNLVERTQHALQHNNHSPASMYANKLNQVKRNADRPIHICVMTSIVNKSRGDASAAKRLFQTIKSIQNLNVKLTWILRRDSHDDSLQSYCPDNVNLIEVTSNYSKLEETISLFYGFYEFRDPAHTTGQEALKELIDSDLVIVAPTAHLLTRSDSHLFNLLKIPTATITEYDSMQEFLLNFITGIKKLSKYYHGIQTGFGKNSLGVYIPETKCTMKLADCIHDKDLCTHLARYDNKTPPILVISTQKDSMSYHLKQSLMILIMSYSLSSKHFMKNKMRLISS